MGVRGKRLEIRKGRAALDSVRLATLEQVVLCGNVQITPQALRAVLREGVDTVLLNRGGAFVGRVGGGAGRHIELRRAQFCRLEEPAFALELARRCVRGKLRNQRALLARYQRTRRDDRIARALVSIRLMLERLPAAGSLDELRGVEGRAAAEYFGAFPALLTAPGVDFPGRKRRPPPDPLNILLSFGYTLLGNLVQGNVELAGADPYLGALHAPERGRPSLALDLMEEWRPVVVDAAVLKVVNTRVIRPDDFTPAEGEDAEEAVMEEAWERQEAEQAGQDAPPMRRRLLLSAQGSRQWFTAYERRLEEVDDYPEQARRMSYRQIIRQQVYLLCRHLMGEGEYEPFIQG